MNDTLPADSMRWYTFVANAKKEAIQVILTPGSVGYVHTISLYAACGSSPIAQAFVTGITQDTLILTDTNFTVGDTCFVQLSDTATSCSRCGAGNATYSVARIGYIPGPPTDGGCIDWAFTVIDGQYPLVQVNPFISRDTYVDGCCCPQGSQCENSSDDDGDDGSSSGCGFTVCQGTEVAFGVNPTYTGPCYLKVTDITNPGVDEVLSSYDQASYVFNFTDTYSVTFVDGSGNPLTGQSVGVDVEPLPKPTFTASPDINPICMGTPITLIRTDVFPAGQSYGFTTLSADNYFNNSGFPPQSPFTFVPCEYSLSPGQNEWILLATNGGVVNLFQNNGGVGVSGCAAESDEIMNIIALAPTFTIQYDPCNAGYAIFTNTSTCPDPSNNNYTWEWDFGDGTPDYYGPYPPKHFYAARNTTYTVTCTVSDPNCGSEQYTQTITINPPQITISGPDLACSVFEGNNSYCATVTGGSGNFTNQIFTLSGGTFAGPLTSVSCDNFINVTLTDGDIGGVVYYSVTDANTGCVYTDSLVIRGCCSCESALALPDPDMNYVAHNLNTYFTSGQQAANVSYNSLSNTITFTDWNSAAGNPGPLVINGLLDNDINVIFNNCDVRMGTNAQIKVEPGQSLNLNYSYLHSCSPCSNAWEGIYIEDHTASADIENSLVEDASNAIVSIDGGSYTVNGSVLNKDYNGIMVEQFNATHTGVIENSTIACNTSSWPSLTLGSPTTLIAPYTGLRTNAGFIVNNVYSILIGMAYSGEANTFENLDYGVISKASDVTVYNNTFNDNAPADKGITAVYDIGDLTGTKQVNIGGNTAYEPNTFDNWITGVFLRDTLDANVINNSFAANNVSLNLENTFFNHIYITGNTMTSMDVGVNGYNNARSFVYIENNTLTNPSPFPYLSFGVCLNEIIFNYYSYYVSGNTITGLDNGVYATNVTQWRCMGNTISVKENSSPGLNNGVYSGGGQGAIISDNSLSIPAFSNNNVSDGVFVNYGTGGNQVSCNNSATNNNGVAFAGPAVGNFFGDNSMTGNGSGLLLFPSTAIGIQGSSGHPNDNEWFTCTYAETSSNPQNAFWVRSPSGTSYWPTNNNGPGVQFTGTSGSSCYDCLTGSFGCGGTGGNPHTPDALKIINDSTPFTSYVNSSQWLYKYSLYEYLKTNDSLLGNYYILHFRDSVKTANMGLLDSINMILADTNGVNTGDINAATILSETIGSPDTIEQTTQTVDNIIISMEQSGQTFPGTTQIGTLQGIAVLCPAQYGNAVFTARALLSQVDTTHYISSCEILTTNVDTSGRYMKRNLTNDTILNAKVYPNPADNLLTIEVPFKVGSVVYFELYNSIGQQIRDMKLQQSLSTLPLSDLAEGMYYFKIRDNSGNIIKADKLTIIH